MYQKTQIGKALNLILISIFIFIVILFSISKKPISITIWIITILIFLFIISLFFSLTVTVDEKWVKLRFGIGIIRKKFALAEIEKSQPVTNPWYYSLGIHTIPDGWIFNVSGLKGVELVLKNGKHIRIGSAQPEKLNEAIQKWILKD